MELMTTHVDSEGFTHAEVCLESDYLSREEMVDVAVKKVESLNLTTLVEIDKREEDGFEFFHIKGV